MINMELRGKCKEMSEKIVNDNPGYRLVRGHYFEPFWGSKAMQQHWWVETPDGTIIDPTKDQFPSAGKSEYIEFDGTVECHICHKTLKEEDAIFEGNGHYVLCSGECRANLLY